MAAAASLQEQNSRCGRHYGLKRECVEPAAEFVEFLAQPGDLGFNGGESVRRFLRAGIGKGGCFRRTTERLRITGLLHPGHREEFLNQSAFASFGEFAQNRFYLVQIAERVYALGSALDFPRGLRASKHQDAKRGGFATPEIEFFGKTLGEFRDAARAAD